MKNILDIPETTIESAGIIRQKKFLYYLYLDFYRTFKKTLEKIPKGKILELGSGGGFIKEVIPEVITSDVLKLPLCDKIVNAQNLPFGNNSLAAILMLNTFHHIKHPKKSLTEFSRCLKKGGRVIMIEPYNSLWGRFIYKNFHYEGFDENAGWKINGSGPLSDANNALPWIVFERDRDKFQKMFPEFEISTFVPHTPFRYLISGGLKKLQLLPGSLFPVVTNLEKMVSGGNGLFGMFVTIVLTKR